MTNRYIEPVLGTDSGPGTSAGTGAWRTLDYALSVSSATVPGDHIKLRTGNYDEFITPEKSGTAGNPITIEADTGQSPVLRGANSIAGIIDISGGRKYLTFADGLYFSYHLGAPGGNFRFAWMQISGVNTTNIIVKNCTFERPGWAVRDDLATSPWQEWAIQIDGAKDCTVDTVLIKGTNIGIQPKGACTGLTIKNSDIGYTTLSCVVLGDSNAVSRGLVLINNKIHNSAIEDGIQFHQSFDAPDDSIDMSNIGTLVLFNQIYENGENAIDLKGAQFVVLEGNAIWLAYGSGNGFEPGAGFNTNSMGAIIRGARTSTKRVITRNNIVYNSGGAQWVFPFYKSYNNTYVYNKTTYAGTNTATEGKAHGIRQQGQSAGVGVKNNIFIAHEYDISIFASTDQPTNEVDIDYNLYGTSKWQDETNGQIDTTLTAWRSRLAGNNWRYGKDTHSFTVASHAAIKFVSVPSNPTGIISAYNFGLQSTSPAKNAGGPLTFTVGAGTNSDHVQVIDSTWFSDIFGRTDVHIRDRIFFGGQERDILAVDDATNTLTVTPNASWIDGQPVFYARMGDVATTTPDVGAQNFSATGGGTPPTPPIEGGPGGRAVTRILLNTTPGNQNFTFPAPLSANPLAWRFTVSYAAVDDTAASPAHIGRGYAWNNSGTIVQAALAGVSEDNVTTSNTNRRSITDGCILLLVPNATTIDAQASFVGGTLGGGTINITNAPTSAVYVTIEAFSPTSAYLGPFDIQTTQDAATTIPFGFQPNYFEVVTNNRAIPSSASNITMSIGYATRTGTTLTQQCLMLRDRNGQSPTQVFGQIRSDYIGADISDFGSILCGLLLQNLTATTGEIATKLGPHPETTPKGFIFAMLFEQRVWSGIVNMPLTPSSSFNIPVAFSPGSADIISSTMTTQNTIEDTVAGAVGLGVWDGVSQFMTSVADQDNVATTNTQSYIDNQFINLRKQDGTAGIAGTCSAVTTNLQLNLTTVPGTAAKQIVVALGIPFVPTLTSDFSGTPRTGIGGATVVFTDLSTASGTTITEWAWDFGDGNAAATQNPTHIYTTAGSFTVTLAVSDGAISNIKVKTDYVVITSPPDVGIEETGYVIAAAGIPVQAYSDVFMGAGLPQPSASTVFMGAGPDQQAYSDVFAAAGVA